MKLGMFAALFCIFGLMFLLGCTMPGQTTTCTPELTCDDWSECMAPGVQTKTCTDINYCGDNASANHPVLEQSCVYAHADVAEWTPLHEVTDDPALYLGEQVTVKGTLESQGRGYSNANQSFIYQLTEDYENQWGRQEASLIVIKDPKETHYTGEEYYATGVLREYTQPYCSCVQYVDSVASGTPWNSTTQGCVNDYSGNCDNSEICDNAACECGCIPGTTEDVVEFYYLDMTDHALQPV